MTPEVPPIFNASPNVMHLIPNAEYPETVARASATRRRITIVVTAALTVVAVDLGVHRIDADLAAYYINRYERKLAALAALPQKPAIVLMGSSRAKYGLVPEEFQRVARCRAFNLGIPAAKTIEWRLLAERAFADYNPRLVVLGVNASDVRADYLPVPAAVDLFDWGDFLDYGRTDGWSSIVAEKFLVRRLGGAWAFFGRRYGLKLFMQERVAALFPKHAQVARERREMAAAPCPEDGFEHPWLFGRNLRNLGLALEDQGDRVWAAEVPPFSPDAGALRHFESLLTWFGDHDIRLIVAYLPNSPRTERRWRGAEPQMAAAIEDLCRRYDVPFVSARETAGERTNYDFLEELHAGLPLARRISERVARRIIDARLLDESPSIVARLPEDEIEAP